MASRTIDENPSDLLGTIRKSNFINTSFTSAGYKVPI